jgi:hypothetical protein
MFCPKAIKNHRTCRLFAFGAAIACSRIAALKAVFCRFSPFGAVLLFMWLNPFKELRKINVVNLFKVYWAGYLYVAPSKFDF